MCEILRTFKNKTPSVCGNLPHSHHVWSSTENEILFNKNKWMNKDTFDYLHRLSSVEMKQRGRTMIEFFDNSVKPWAQP